VMLGNKARVTAAQYGAPRMASSVEFVYESVLE